MGGSILPVTSSLAVHGKSRDHGDGGAVTRSREKRAKSIAFKMFTYNSFSINILRTLFAKSGPVRSFPGVEAEGAPSAF